MPQETPDNEIKKRGWRPWLKRLGIAGFLFFLVKGLIWIAIFAGVGKCVMQ